MSVVPQMIEAFIDRNVSRQQIESDLVSHGLTVDMFNDEANIVNHGKVTQVFVNVPIGTEDAWVLKLPSILPYIKEIDRLPDGFTDDW